jgi:hypothetical protein
MHGNLLADDAGGKCAPGIRLIAQRARPNALDDVGQARVGFFEVTFGAFVFYCFSSGFVGRMPTASSSGGIAAFIAPVTAPTTAPATARFTTFLARQPMPGDSVVLPF